MKKLITLVLAAGLFLSAVQGFAVPKDSTTLASESVMSSSVDRSMDGNPIGMISIWATADPIPDGWLECNGQVVNADKYPEYVAKFGATTPDYRGFFLRGFGGKSGALGVVQDYAVQTHGTEKVFFQGLGIGELDYVNSIEYTAPSVSKKRMMSLDEFAIDRAINSGQSGTLTTAPQKQYSFQFVYNPNSYQQNTFKQNNILWITDNLIDEYNDYLKYYDLKMQNYYNYKNNLYIPNYKYNSDDGYIYNLEDGRKISIGNNADDVNNFDFHSLIDYVNLKDFYNGFIGKYEFRPPQSLGANHETFKSRYHALTIAGGREIPASFMYSGCVRKYGNKPEIKYTTETINQKYNDGVQQINNYINSIKSGISRKLNLNQDLVYKKPNTNNIDMTNEFAQYVRLFSNQSVLDFGSFIGRFYIGYGSYNNLINKPSQSVKILYNNNINGSGENFQDIYSVYDNSLYMSVGSTYSAGDCCIFVNSSQTFEEQCPGDYIELVSGTSGTEPVSCKTMCFAGGDSHGFKLGLKGNISTTYRFIESVGKTNAQIVDELVKKYNRYLSGMGYSLMKTFDEFEGVSGKDKMKEYENYIYSFRSKKIPVSNDSSPGSFSAVLESQTVLNPDIGKTYELESSVESVAGETRPVNKAVKYIIKVQ